MNNESKEKKLNFVTSIISSSESKYYNNAILEWEYYYSFKENNHCICGQPITENCVIKNEKNGSILTIGNVCLSKITDKDYSFVFKGIDSVRRGKIPKLDFIEYCEERGYIYEGQALFLTSIKGKRKLSEKQINYRDKILFKLSLRKRF